LSKPFRRVTEVTPPPRGSTSLGVGLAKVTAKQYMGVYYRLIITTFIKNVSIPGEEIV
jgi:hypothetical protein